jgi:hypothetical protein
MKVVELPPNEDETKDVHEMLDHAKTVVDESGITDAVLVMLDAEGNVGMSIASDEITANGILTMALKAI